MDQEFGMAAPPKPITVRIVEVFGILLVATIIISVVYFVVFSYRNKNVIILEPETVSVVMDSNDTLETVSEKWLNKYLDQYKQRFISHKKKIDSVNIKNTEILEVGKYKIVQIDFDIKPKTRLSRYYLTWGTYDDDSRTVQCQWVIWFTSKRDSDDNIVYSCYKTQTPSGYRINEENEDDIESTTPIVDDEGTSNVNGVVNECVYIIESDKMSVSYNYGTSWTEVPVSLEELFGSESYRTGDASLPEESYVIGKDITAFVFGGDGEIPLSCFYSSDMGLNWSVTRISTSITDARMKICDFVNRQLGYIVVSHKTGSWQETQDVFKTTDGGATWSKVGSGPRQTKMYDASFVYTDIGFLCYEYSEYYTMNMYSTDNGGISYKPMALPVKDEWKNIFIQPHAPYIRDDLIYLKIEQGEDSDYMDGEVKALYVSENLGKTWRYEGLVDE